MPAGDALAITGSSSIGPRQAEGDEGFDVQVDAAARRADVGHRAEQSRKATAVQNTPRRRSRPGWRGWGGATSSRPSAAARATARRRDRHRARSWQAPQRAAAVPRPGVGRQVKHEPSWMRSPSLAVQSPALLGGTSSTPAGDRHPGPGQAGSRLAEEQPGAERMTTGMSWMIQAVLMGWVVPSANAWISRLAAMISPSSRLTPAPRAPAPPEAAPPRADHGEQHGAQGQAQGHDRDRREHLERNPVARKDAPHTTTANSAHRRSSPRGDRSSEGEEVRWREAEKRGVGCQELGARMVDHSQISNR